MSYFKYFQTLVQSSDLMSSLLIQTQMRSIEMIYGDPIAQRDGWWYPQSVFIKITMHFHRAAIKSSGAPELFMISFWSPFSDLRTVHWQEGSRLGPYRDETLFYLSNFSPSRQFQNDKLVARLGTRKLTRLGELEACMPASSLRGTIMI